MSAKMIVFRARGQAEHDLPSGVPVASASLQSSKNWRILNSDGAQADVVYVQHPRTSGALVTYAGFHPWIEDEKVQSALTFVTALGVSRVTLRRESQKDTAFKVSLPALFAKIAGDLQVSRRESNLYEVVREGPGARPRPVPPLTWADPSWAGLEEGVRKGQFTTHRLVVENDDNLGIGGTLASKFLKHKISLGGDLKKVSSTRYVFELEFPAKS